MVNGGERGEGGAEESEKNGWEENGERIRKMG